jgi:hypothetical protein
MPKKKVKKPRLKSNAKKTAAKQTVTKKTVAKKAKPLRVEQYEHTDKKRINNPPVGLVTAHSDNGNPRKKQYA